jgi:phosphatidylglycerol:prolipoprotein diacylglycerol transferase
VNPIALQIGQITIYWYGILIVASVLVGAAVSIVQASKRAQDPEHVWNALLLCLILGIVGARIYHVFSISQGGAIGWPYYREHPNEAFKIWKGGLGLIGAIIGGSLGTIVYARLAKLPILTWLDISSYGFLIAQVIGRWGNYINQELYGPPTKLPWGISIDYGHRIIPFHNLQIYPLETRFHPVFLYESLWCLLGFILLWWLSARWRDRLLAGEVFWLTLIWYGVGRFALEYLRPDAWMWGPIAAAQVFCALFCLGSVVALVLQRRAHTDALTQTHTDKRVDERTDEPASMTESQDIP